MSPVPAKHSALTFNDASHVQPTLEMLHMMAGGEKKFRERPFAHGGGCCVISPLRYGCDNSEVCVESIKFGAPGLGGHGAAGGRNRAGGAGRFCGAKRG